MLARLAKQIELGLATVEVSPPQYRVLVSLAEGKAAASALADRLAVSKPSVTAVVDGLVERGLVERRHEVADRRRVAHELTPAGRRLLIAADEEAAAMSGLDVWRRALDAARDAKAQEVRR